MQRYGLLGRMGIGRKRAVVAVQVAVFIVVILGFAALTVDVGALYNVRADLQRTADAAALAAAARLSDYGGGNPEDLARVVAQEYTEKNSVFGRTLTIDPNADVTFGRATFDPGASTFTFTPGSPLPDAVQVRVRHTADSPNGSVSLYFAKVFGFHTADLTAEALAVMVPRDIAIVADLSASHSDDSEFRHYQLTDINMFDVWDELPGGIGEVGSNWDINDIPPEWVEPDGNVPQAAGPGWGFMTELGFGTETVDSSYDPTTDPGLVELGYNKFWNNNQLKSYLADVGYNQLEVNALTSPMYDADGAWQYRAAAALGVAEWYSGLGVDANGNLPLWQKRGLSSGQAGNANDWVGGSEVTFTQGLLGRSASASASIWRDYINAYVNSTYTEMYKANSAFRYRFGVKTLTNYLMERRASNSQTPELADVPLQPMQAVKDAVAYLSTFLEGQGTNDQLSLEIYGTTARHEVDLTNDFTQVSDRLSAMQAGHYDPYTNVGGGIARAIEELTSTRARGTSKKVIVLLTDGVANVSASGSAGTTEAAESAGAAYAVAQAQAAAALGIRIVAVSVGAESNQTLMQQIADITQGEHFHAEGSISEYSAQLVEIFQRIGGQRPVELIQ